MSGHHETSEAAEQTDTDAVPVPPAPPSFGHADEPSGVAEPAVAEQELSFDPAPGTTRPEHILPKPVSVFGPNMPWWAEARDDEPSATADVPEVAANGAEGVPEAWYEAEAAAGDAPAQPAQSFAETAEIFAQSESPWAEGGTAEAAQDIQAGAAGSPVDYADADAAEEPGWFETADEQGHAAGADAAEVDYAGAEDSRQTAPTPAGTPLDTLVAGNGAPHVDTRGAVPAEPIVATSGPPSDDTDPDGIPAYPGDGIDTAADTVVDMAPALMPDAILPPGFPLSSRTGGQGEPEQTTVLEDVPAPPWAPNAPEMPLGAPVFTETPQQTVITPAYHADGSAPLDVSAPTSPPADRNRRRSLMIAGLVAGAIVIAGAAYAGLSTATGASDRPAKDARATAGPGTAAPTSPDTAPNGGAPGGPPKIDNERTDPRPLALTEVFPTADIALGARSFNQDKTSVNHQCTLAAAPAMGEALSRAGCTSVVRATYINRVRTIGVTAGIAVLPTRKAAVTVSTAGDPSRYNWFTGMPGKRTADIAQAGGYAASTVRGRYLAYAYVTYTDGTKPKPGDPQLKEIADQFIGYVLRPIDARAR